MSVVPVRYGRMYPDRGEQPITVSPHVPIGCKDAVSADGAAAYRMVSDSSACAAQLIQQVDMMLDLVTAAVGIGHDNLLRSSFGGTLRRGTLRLGVRAYLHVRYKAILAGILDRLFGGMMPPVLTDSGQRTERRRECESNTASHPNANVDM